MCGFIAVFDKNGNLRSKSSRIIDAGELLYHRGPDDYGSYFDDYTGLYFRRLSIIDLSDKGNQPFESQNKELVLVYNGEIYNYKELKGSLIEKGYEFVSNSDTEVLIKAYEEFGDNCVNYFRGMFAFALWNKKLKTLTLSRDRFGIKPLYIYNSSDQIVIASEIKSILHFAPESKEIDERSSCKYIARTFADDTNDTFFKNIKSIKPASIVKITKDNISESIYWQLDYSENNKLNIDKFRNVFEEAISQHTRADVPVSANLSGGMDSTSIVGTVAKINSLNNKLKTFSVIPPETFDESFWINKTVKSTEVDHEYINLDLNDIPKTIDEIILKHDEPFQYSSCIYQFLLRDKIAQKNIKVLLVGEGADEVLAGYRRIIYPYLLAMYDRGNVREFFEVLKNCKSLLNYDSERQVIDGLLNYHRIISNNENGQENNASYTLLNDSLIKKYGDIDNEPIYQNSTENPEDNFFQTLFKHLFVRNLPYVLRMEDRNSMAKSIEARVPFLDHVFVEMVFSHDFSEFMKGGDNKALLRKAMEGYIPVEVLNRKNKTNRPGNHAHLVYKTLKDEIVNLLKAKEVRDSSYWNSNLLDIFLEDFENNNLQRAEVWFRVYIFERWRKLFNV